MSRPRSAERSEGSLDAACALPNNLGEERRNAVLREGAAHGILLFRRMLHEGN